MSQPETGRLRDFGGLAGLILAAGSSSRLGQPKQLVLVDGEALVRRTARLALGAGCSRALVVLGAEVDGCRAALAGLPITVIGNADWQEGMGSSLRCGVRAVSEMQAAALLVMVCDQPRLTAESLERLVQAYQAGDGVIVAARYDGRLGVPAIFPASVFGELEQAAGDQGARAVLMRYRHEVVGVDLPEAAFDVDVPADLSRLMPGSRQ